MPAYSAIAEKNDQLLRKALDGSLFVAPFSADPITTLTGPDSLLTALPTGYTDGGLTTDAGIQMPRKVSVSEITSWGRNTPSRSDKTSDIVSVTVDFQEVNKTTLGLYTGVDLSTAQVALNGELHIQKPSTPVESYFRLLALAVDQADGGEFYVAKFFPRCKVTDYTDQVFAKGDAVIGFGMTFTTYVDDALGYSQDDIIAGPGALALATAMGFTVATA
jgi:hypothetical protein